MLNVKNADMADFEQIMKIYKYAQDYMIKMGDMGYLHCLKVQNLLISILRMGIG